MTCCDRVEEREVTVWKLRFQDQVHGTYELCWRVMAIKIADIS